MRRGSVHVITGFYSKALDSIRTLRVYLPPQYETSQERYPVVYLHDGQWMFSEKGKKRWDVDLTADDLIWTGYIPPVILVGIDCNEKDRRREMTHTTPPPFRKMGRRGYIPCYAFEGEGLGFSYEAFLADEVKPYIDSHFRTKPEKENTMLAGSSMGGIVTLCMGMNRHDIYGMLGLISPAIHWLSDEFYNSIKNYGQKIWLDCGMAEAYYVDNTRELYRIFAGIGYRQGVDLNYLAQPDAVHTEQYFGQRFRMILLWMLGEKTKPKAAAVQGRNTVSVNGYPAVLNTVLVYENGIMSSDMNASYEVEPEGILEIDPAGEIKAVHPGEAVITYKNGDLVVNKQVTAVNSLSGSVLLNISVEVPEDTPEEDPVVYHFFRDQYCVLKRKSRNVFTGSIGVPRDWEFYGHFGRCAENRDIKKECTKGGGEVNRFVRVCESQSLYYVVEKWKE